jgi:outer membrane protein assembly factor BamD (BamD/ComL family)
MEKKTILVLISSIICISLFFILTILLVSLNISNSYDEYLTGLEQYNSSDFFNAKKTFEKVNRFSILKPASIYRESLCANKLGNTEEELDGYKKLKKHYPKSKITAKAVYTRGKILYQNKQYSKALKDFKFIASKHKNTKYALASNYYIAQIEAEKYNKNHKKDKEIINRLKEYIISAPNGIYTLKCANLMDKFTLSDEEHVLAGIAYLKNKDYKNAEKHLTKTDINISWPYLVKLYFAQNDYKKVRELTENGLSQNPEITTKELNDATYTAIDKYLRTYDNPKIGINTLLNIGNKNRNYDYVMFKNCNITSGQGKSLCYETLYKTYPNGNFAAESLANVFYNNVRKGNYKEAIKLGKTYLNQYKNTKSTPRVLYWMMHTYNAINDVTMSRYFYKMLMSEYPDDYYTYTAFINENNLKYGFQGLKITPKDVEFPYQNSNDKLLSALLFVEDYGLINNIYDDDEFIRSWLLYQSGDYENSARIARDAIDKLDKKPPKDDLRWRLVYPIHYYDIIQNNPTSDKTIILSIIREESYFNPNAKSHVGAMGLMQLMPSTANEIAHKTGYALTNINFLYEPTTNIKLGILYFNHIKNLLSGKSQLAILAYNGGAGSVKKWQTNIDSTNFEDFIENIPFPETKNYYKKVYKSYWNYLRIYDGLNF